MIIKTHTEILNEICDAFDESIAPKRISRSEGNLLYKLFKAVAKGFEVINNTCVALQNKFDPATSSDEDLVSIGKLVGTNLRAGKQSALRIKVKNSSAVTVSLLPATYVYRFSEDTAFSLLVSSAKSIAPGETIILSAYSDAVGAWHVTAQSSLTLYPSDDTVIPEGVTFSCEDNSALLGRAAETAAQFRARVLSDSDRQDAIRELEEAIRDLPYIFEASVVFNQTGAPVVVDGITIQPFSILIVILGEARAEIADIVASHGFYPTTQVSAENVLYYRSTCLANGVYPVFYTNYRDTLFSVAVDYAYDSYLISPAIAEGAITEALSGYMYPTEKKNLITEDEFYGAIKALHLSGVTLRNVSILVDGVEVPYLAVKDASIAKLSGVSYTSELV